MKKITVEIDDDVYDGLMMIADGKLTMLGAAIADAWGISTSLMRCIANGRVALVRRSACEARLTFVACDVEGSAGGFTKEELS